MRLKSKRITSRRASILPPFLTHGQVTKKRIYEQEAEFPGVGFWLIYLQREKEITMSTSTTSKLARDMGANFDIHFATRECSLGSVLVAKNRRGVCAILIDDDPGMLIQDLQERFPKANLIGDEPGSEDLVAKVVGFIENPGVGLNLILDTGGTAFQRRVWKALQQIPAGSTVSYTDIARQIGMPRAVRAVAQACGANPLAVAIPCHRVIRNDEALSGYRWGVERKRVLLDREAHA